MAIFSILQMLNMFTKILLIRHNLDKSPTQLRPTSDLDRFLTLSIFANAQ